MRRAALRENAILAVMSGPASMMNLVIPLYFAYLKYPLALVGAMITLASVASLASRFVVPRIYRPERSRILLIASLVCSIGTFFVFPLVTDVAAFAAALVVNRVLMGIATTVFLARYLDMLAVGADRRQAMGWYGGTQAMGYTSSNVFVGLLADYLGYFAAFMYGAVFCAVAAAILFWAPELSPKAPGERPDPARVTGPRSFLHGLTDPGLMGVLNVGFWNNLFHLVLVSFFPAFGVSIGLGPAQVGLVRGMYSGINAVGRPMLVALIRRFTLRQVTYIGIIAQMILMSVLSSVHIFALVVGILAIFACARAIVVVSNSAGLAEEVDETRVSRGLATSSFSAISDISNFVGPLVAGFVADAVGVRSMFPLLAAGAFACFLATDFTVQHLRRRSAAALAT